MELATERLQRLLTEVVVGCKERGRQVDGPLDHSTGKGWVKDHAYGDGWVEKNGSRKWTGGRGRSTIWSARFYFISVLQREVGQESHNAAGAR